MRVSMWTTYLYGLPLKEMVTTFASHGWQWLELSTEHGLELLEQGDPGKAGREFARFCADQDVRFPQGHLWLGADIVHPDTQERERTMDLLKRSCALFDALGITAAVLHAGGGGLREQGCPPEEVFTQQVKSLERILTFVKGTGVTICLENGRSGLEPLTPLIEALSSDQLAICLDTGHLNLGDGDQVAFVRAAGPKLKALHIADNRGERDDHLFPYGGRCTARWEGFVDALHEVGFDGLWNYEVPGESMQCPMELRLLKLDYGMALANSMLGQTEQ